MIKTRESVSFSTNTGKDNIVISDNQTWFCRPLWKRPIYVIREDISDLSEDVIRWIQQFLITRPGRNWSKYLDQKTVGQVSGSNVTARRIRDLCVETNDGYRFMLGWKMQSSGLIGQKAAPPVIEDETVVITERKKSGWLSFRPVMIPPNMTEEVPIVINQTSLSIGIMPRMPTLKFRIKNMADQKLIGIRVVTPSMSTRTPEKIPPYWHIPLLIDCGESFNVNVKATNWGNNAKYWNDLYWKTWFMRPFRTQKMIVEAAWFESGLRWTAGYGWEEGGAQVPDASAFSIKVAYAKVIMRDLNINGDNGNA